MGRPAEGCRQGTPSCHAAAGSSFAKGAEGHPPIRRPQQQPLVQQPSTLKLIVQLRDHWSFRYLSMSSQLHAARHEAPLQAAMEPILSIFRRRSSLKHVDSFVLTRERLSSSGGDDGTCDAALMALVCRQDSLTLARARMRRSLDSSDGVSHSGPHSTLSISGSSPRV